MNGMEHSISFFFLFSLFPPFYSAPPPPTPLHSYNYRINAYYILFIEKIKILAALSQILHFFKSHPVFKGTAESALLYLSDWKSQLQNRRKPIMTKTHTTYTTRNPTKARKQTNTRKAFKLPRMNRSKKSQVLTYKVKDNNLTILETYNVDVKFKSLVEGMDKPKKHTFLCFGKPKPQIFYDVPELPGSC